MAQVMKMRWEGVTPEQYDRLRQTVGLETEPPDGLISHVTWFREGSFIAMDVWESSGQFDAFFQSRLGPAVEQIGIGGQPEMKWFDAHAYFIPGVLATTSV
jgi:hypothetical protein